MVGPIENEDELMLGMRTGNALQAFVRKHTNAFQFSLKQKAGVYGYPHVWTIIANFANTNRLIMVGSLSYVLNLYSQAMFQPRYRPS